MFRRGVAAFLPLAVTSCIYVHQADRQKSAEGAKTDFGAIAAALPNGDPVKQWS